MYVPPRFQVSDPQAISALLRDTPFATLITAGPGGLMASHLPIELRHGPGGERLLEGHVSRANPQWHAFGDGEGLAVFLGPHAYVSPTWYDHPNVPTWNYQAVHCYGPIRAITDTDELLAMLRRLSERHEPSGSPPPRFDVDAMPPALRAAELRGIVGFELRVSRVEAAFKLSQNRDPADHARIVRELAARPDDASRAVARAMGRTAVPPGGTGGAK